MHRRIMARLPEWCDEAALVHWVQEASYQSPHQSRGVFIQALNYKLNILKIVIKTIRTVFFIK